MAFDYKCNAGWIEDRMLDSALPCQYNSDPRFWAKADGDPPEEWSEMPFMYILARMPTSEEIRILNVRDSANFLTVVASQAHLDTGHQISVAWN